MENKKRVTWLDMAKGYGIILVILAHLRIGKVGSWIYTFHIPLFFLLSGYVFHTKENFSLFLKSKSKSILVPYFCLGTVIFLFESGMKFILGDLNLHNYLSLFIRFLIQKRLWTVWFLACLFFLNIIFYFAKKTLKSDRNLTFLAILLPCLGTLYYKMGGQTLFWNIDVCLMAFPFFFIGYFYKENQEYVDGYLDNKRTSIILFLICGLINIVFGYLSYKISGNGLDMFETTYGFIPFTFISAFAGIICIILISKWLVVKPIKYIGENSLLYFAWHQTIMIPISNRILVFLHFTMNESSNIFNASIYKLIQLLIILLLCTICNIIISNTKLRFMLGKI